MLTRADGTPAATARFANVARDLFVLLLQHAAQTVTLCTALPTPLQPVAPPPAPLPPAPPAPAVVAWSMGFALHLSASSSTGYLNVQQQPSGRFGAKRRVDGKQVSVGCFGTAVEAAVEYARAVAEAEGDETAGARRRGRPRQTSADLGQVSHIGGGGGEGQASRRCAQV